MNNKSKYLKNTVSVQVAIISILICFSSSLLAQKHIKVKTGYSSSYKFGKLDPIGTKDFVSLYDHNGHLTDSTIYKTDGTIFVRYVFKYNTHNQIVEQSIFKGTILNQRIVNKFDSIGRNIEELQYDSDGKLVQKLSINQERMLIHGFL